VWSLVTQKIVSLKELETFWSLEDVLKAYAILQFTEDLSIERRKKAQNVNSKKSFN